MRFSKVCYVRKCLIIETTFETLHTFLIILVTSRLCKRVSLKSNIVSSKRRKVLKCESLILLSTRQELVSNFSLNAIIDKLINLSRQLRDVIN